MNEKERSEVTREVRDIVEGTGFEILRLTIGHDRSIHLMLDKPEGRVTVEDTRTFNLRIRRELFAKGIDTDFWTVEVESPGVFRPIVGPTHFIRFRGERIRIVRRAADAPHRVVVGVLEHADEDGFRIVGEEGGPLDLPYHDVADARLEPKLPF